MFIDIMIIFGGLRIKFPLTVCWYYSQLPLETMVIYYNTTIKSKSATVVIQISGMSI